MGKLLIQKGRGNLVEHVVKSITFSKIRAGLTQPFISTDENLLMKNKGLPLGQKMHFPNAFFGLKSLTLIETVIASAILLVCLTAFLTSFMMMFILADLSRDITSAKNAAQAQMEEMHRIDFGTLLAQNGTTFPLAGFNPANAMGRIEVTNVVGYADLREVRIVASFRSKRRPIGEDINFNGQLDAGEDTNGNGRLDSPVEVVTLIAR
ncbi:MAG: hypothetical protein Q8O30_12095 [Candidatus Omnitrophota bacterium]|nr:hypothetical protein [Candidatus Omnitrophota bacterium]